MSWSVGEVWVLATELQSWEPMGLQVWVPATGGHWGAEVWIQSRVGVQAQLLERSVFHECILTVAFKLHRAERRSGIETFLLMFLRVLFRFVWALKKTLFSTLDCVAARVCICVRCIRPLATHVQPRYWLGLGTQNHSILASDGGMGQFTQLWRPLYSLPLTQGKASHGTWVLFKWGQSSVSSGLTYAICVGMQLEKVQLSEPQEGIHFCRNPTEVMWYTYPAFINQSGIPESLKMRLDLTSLGLCLNKWAHSCGFCFKHLHSWMLMQSSMLCSSKG